MPLIRSENSVPIPALLKRFALIYLLIIMVLSVALLTGIQREERIHVKEIEGRENSRIVIAKGLVTRDLATVATDLRVFAKLPMLRLYLDSGNPAQREELEKLFLVLSREARRYDQVRYLDASGQEVIRINYNDGKPAIVPREQLQNKLGRYYFDDAHKLNQDEIFVSPLDLNIEQGSLEIPHKPMIRFATPVFDSAGRKKGIILLNYFGDNLLQNFRGVMQEENQHSGMLLNRDGYWLSGAKHEDEWGFMLGKKELTFGHDYAEAWRTISAAERGTLRTDQGLFAYTTVYPLLPEQHSATGSALANAPSQKEVKAHEYHWKIVSLVPNSTLSGTAFYNQTSGRIVLVFVYLLLALAAWIVAHVTLRNKQAVKELRTSEARFRKLFENSNDAIFIHTLTGEILDANPQAENMMGYPLAVLKTMPVPALHPPEELETSKKAFEETISKGSTRFESRFRHSGGALIDVEISSRIVDREKGIIQGIARDITGRKRAEEDLRLRAQLLDSANDAIFVHDLDGNFIYLNEVAWKSRGYMRDELMGMNLHALDVPEYEKLIEARGRELMEKGQCAFESAHRRKDGSVMPIEVSARLIESGGRKLVISAARDITERKKAEEVLRSAHEEVLKKSGRLEMFQQVAVNREMRMVEMKAEVNGLLERLGEPRKYAEVDSLKKK